MNTRTLAIASTLVALLATPAFAQHQHGQMHSDSTAGMTGDTPSMQSGMMSGGMMSGGMMGMMQSMHPGPGMILGAADALDLTEAQRERLRTLQEQSAAQHRGHMQAAMATRRQASEALNGDDPDLDAYEAALRDAANHMVEGHLAMTTTALQARDVLNPEQRKVLQGAMSMMHHMRGGMGMDGMMGGSMHDGPGGHDGHR